jgi:hypothetical protein
MLIKYYIFEYYFKFIFLCINDRCMSYTFCSVIKILLAFNIRLFLCSGLAILHIVLPDSQINKSMVISCGVNNESIHHNTANF